jgi:C_GCAxxG_C_C family probable redox protein
MNSEGGSRPEMLKENKELLAETAEKMGHDFERTYHGCSQATLAAVMRTLGIKDEGVFRAAFPFAGGFGLKQGICGGIAGGAMALGLASDKYGRSWSEHSKWDMDTILESMYRTRKYLDRVQKELGTLSCREITKADFSTRAGIDKYIESPEFETCCVNCGKVARIVVEMLLEED